LGIVEIIVILAVALIVIPPENLPEVMRAVGKILRELRLASNMVVRELGGVLDQPSENQAVPPINTMRPGASVTSSNIAQPGASADSATTTDPLTSADPTVASETPAAPSEPINGSAELTTTPDAPAQAALPDAPATR
jgi:sec-independent protein translocase protein TatB